MPRLNQTLNLQIKPALEKTLAEESAYPNGLPIVGPPKVSSEFGIRHNPFGGSRYEVHEGIDFISEQGDVIMATGDGIVAEAGRNGGYGLSVTIDHGYGYKTLYAHMSKVKVEAGDRIKRGQIIGQCGQHRAVIWASFALQHLPGRRSNQSAPAAEAIPAPHR